MKIKLLSILLGGIISLISFSGCEAAHRPRTAQHLELYLEQLSDIKVATAQKAQLLVRLQVAFLVMR